jgi:hypothetical protein
MMVRMMETRKSILIALVLRNTPRGGRNRHAMNRSTSHNLSLPLPLKKFTLRTRPLGAMAVTPVPASPERVDDPREVSTQAQQEVDEEVIADRPSAEEDCESDLSSRDVACPERGFLTAQGGEQHREDEHQDLHETRGHLARSRGRGVRQQRKTTTSIREDWNGGLKRSLVSALRHWSVCKGRNLAP